jgi:signal transduction histidine kinase
LTSSASSGHRRLLIRSYVVLAGGLLIAAVLLDYGFGALQSRQSRASDPVLEAAFQLVERELAAAPVAERDARLAEIATQIKLPAQLLARDEITGGPAAGAAVSSLIDANGRTYYLRHSNALNVLIQLGPIETPGQPLWVRWVPALFYLSILLIVGLWLRPLLRDLRTLTTASEKFASDYREPLDTARHTTQLTSLARNLDDMSGRLSHLIQNQKELTAALSHEVRTPLARIRFALAVIGTDADAPTQSQLHDINNDVQQIDDLIASMLHYTRLDYPTLRLDWLQTPLEPWLQQIIERSVQGGRELMVERDPGLVDARMDPKLMGLALSNLLVNAARHAESRVRLSLRFVEQRYAIVVEDDGSGIPEVARGEVFKAFKRLHTDRNRDTRGFGLGLAIVARVAALHGGSVSADASPDLGGARLTVEWPASASGARFDGGEMSRSRDPSA